MPDNEQSLAVALASELLQHFRLTLGEYVVLMEARDHPSLMRWPEWERLRLAQRHYIEYRRDQGWIVSAFGERFLAVFNLFLTRELQERNLPQIALDKVTRSEL